MQVAILLGVAHTQQAGEVGMWERQIPGLTSPDALLAGTQ